MKLLIAVVCLAGALVCAVVAATTYDLAAGACVLGLALACMGLGLLCEATDPRRWPNPRTAERRAADQLYAQDDPSYPW